MDCWRSVFLRRGGGGEARLRLQHRMSELRNLWLTKRQAVERSVTGGGSLRNGD